MRWEQAVRLMHMEGITRALEIGPGKVLAGVGKRIAKEMKVLSVGDVGAIERVSEFLTSETLAESKEPSLIPPPG